MAHWDCDPRGHDTINQLYFPENALSPMAQLPWKLKKNKVKDHGLTSHGSIGSTDTHCCFKIHLKLCPADYSAGEAGVWLSGLPVGSHHDQLFSHHHGHPRPVWCSPVQITLRYNGKSNTKCCLIRNSCFWFVIKKFIQASHQEDQYCEYTVVRLNIMTANFI